MTDVKLGREIRSDWGWLWTRTKRLANLLLEPNILRGAEQMVEAMDRYADANEIAQEKLALGDAKFIKGMTYVEFPLTD